MLPENIVLVRHGESEGNLVLENLLKGDKTLFTEEFKKRHESEYRLTKLGVEQAHKANEFLKKEFKDICFNMGYTSDFIRAKETASLIDFNKKWKIASILIERDWGDFKFLTPQEIHEKYPNSFKIKKSNPLDWCPPNGERMRDVIIRVRQFVDILHRQHSSNNIIIVCHGEVIHAFKILIEEMNQFEYNDFCNSKNPYDAINNCQIIHYTRENPSTKEKTNSIKWFRSICPWDLSLSDNSWRFIDKNKKIYSVDDLKQMVNNFNPLF